MINLTVKILHHNQSSRRLDTPSIQLLMREGNVCRPSQFKYNKSYPQKPASYPHARAILSLYHWRAALMLTQTVFLLFPG